MASRAGVIGWAAGVRSTVLGVLLMETGPIGYGCLAPEAPDDVHLFHDMHAVVRPPGDPGLFVTSLGRFTPLVMLNLSLGDQAMVRRRACGCPLEELGWVTHLQAIVSREKLTAAGMTFYDSDVIRVLETVLPTRFGGGPTDYQLVRTRRRTAIRGSACSCTLRWARWIRRP